MAHQEYPKLIYKDKDKKAYVIVNNKAEEDALGKKDDTKKDDKKGDKPAGGWTG